MRGECMSLTRGLKRKIRKILKAHDIEKDKISDVLDDILEELSEEISEGKGKEQENGKGSGKEGDSEIEKLKEAHALELTKAKMSSKIELELAKVQSKNNKAVLALIDADKLKLNEKGELEGLSEQLKEVVKANPFLFGTKQQYDPSSGGEPSGIETDLNKAMQQKGFSMTEFLKNLQKEM